MIDTVKTIIAETPAKAYKEGMYAKFKKINDQWGLKFFDREDERDENFNLQKIAWEIDCGPELGEKFNLALPNGKPVYGYVTECIVKDGNRLYAEQFGNESNYDPDLDDVDDYDLHNLYGYTRLIERLKGVMYVYDMHGGNVGILETGRLVVIDFSHCELRSKYS